jgi:hypothetical protein
MTPASGTLPRNLAVSAALVALLVLGAVVLSSPILIAGLAALLALAGIVVLRGNGWRTGSLLAMAVAIAVALLDVFAGFFVAAPHGAGLVLSPEPLSWNVPDADFGYLPRPGARVEASASFDGQPIYRATYTINADSTRVTPPAPAGADSYLFMGDSFMFGQGLNDDQTLAAQFARDNDFKVRSVLFAAPGYAPNQWVRALETGRFDHLRSENLKAIVAWIIPAHLERVDGEQPWLGPAPRYVMETGKPVFTGSFNHHRWTNPLAGLRHFAADQFPFIHAIGLRQRQDAEGKLFTALMVRLQELARERLGASLMVVYSWPDEKSQPHHGDSEVAQPMLVSLLAGLRQRGIPLLRVDDLTFGIEVSRLLFAHDGHPNAFSNQLIAAELKRRLVP